MLNPTSLLGVDLSVRDLLAAFSQAGTAITISIFIGVVYFATRCKGCCREDEIFRSHVI